MKAAPGDLEIVNFKSGEVIFQEGDRSYYFLIVQEGDIDVYLTGKDIDDEEVALGTVGPGEPLGEFALVTGQARSASARARTDAVAVKVSEDAYKKLLDDLPEWAYAVIQSLAERIVRTDEKLKKIQFLDEQTQTEVDLLINQNEI